MESQNRRYVIQVELMLPSPSTSLSGPCLQLAAYNVCRIDIMLRFQTIYSTYHTQTIIGTASFLYLDPIIRRWLLPLYFYIMISLIIVRWDLTQVLLSLYWYIMISVRYNLLLVRLSLVDPHLPLLSFTYTSSYDKRYLNCTSRTLGP